LQLFLLQQQHEQLSSALTTATEQLEEAAEQLTAAEGRIQDLEAAHQHSSASATEQASAAAQARIQLRKAKDAAKQVWVGRGVRGWPWLHVVGGMYALEGTEGVGVYPPS
jgi:DNA-binding protein H-NS